MFQRVAGLKDLRRGEMLGCRSGGRRILLLRTGDGAVHAYEDRCVHLGVALSEGQLEADVITCHAHHYQYDAATGQGVNPRQVCLKSFAVKVEGDDIWVDVGQTAARAAP